MNIMLHHDLPLLAPILILSVGALILLMIDVVLKRAWSVGLFSGVLVLAALLSLYVTYPHYAAHETVFSGLMFVDPFAWIFSALILGGAFLVLLLSADWLESEGIESKGEYYTLFLISCAGALIFATAAELITLFIGLEIMSMALYCLCGSAIDVRRSSEAALKYFLLGSFSSAFLLYGIALIYGLTGTMEISKIAEASLAVEKPMLFFSMGLMMVGLVFKIGLVPFHFWVPDVYEGAPTPITAFMACVIKAAAIAGALRVLWAAFGEMIVFWAGAIYLIAFLTMLFGNIVAIRQRSMKRMLAYSSIAHAGYIQCAFLAPSTVTGGGPAIAYYVLIYTLMTLGAFGVVLAVTSRNPKDKNPDDITHFNGLGYRNPTLAVLMALFMLSLAGLPPGMGGLLGKFYVFYATVAAQYKSLAIIGVLSSAISCYYYLRVIVAMYFIEPSSDDVPVPAVSAPMRGALTICGAAVVLFGLFPSVIYDHLAAMMKASF